ncbi:MAG: hypothetical protein HC769_30045 [Cyanobacteria bacterium CRU_2_1]|nr:hypothetical protein [Cyanobacteria bacterium CRU_2_1]
MQQLQHSESMQLIYRGAYYTLKRPQQQTVRSIASNFDRSLSDVQIPRGFKYLLYRGQAYLIPCY